MTEHEATQAPIRCLFSRDGLPACASGPCATCDYLSVFDRMVEPPTSRSTLGESRAASASPDLHVKILSPTIPMPEWLRIDLGLPPAEPEPTPIERALAILAPHLADQPLYRA